MKLARWHQIEHLYNQALEIEESKRTSFLREACAADDDLRRELEGLLAEERPAAGFLEKPALREIAHEFEAAEGASWVGRQIGNYEFVSLAGAGGMGEVYRSRDTRLKREVAIKVLPGEFSRDPDRVSRFQREAQLLASLNHPNIAAIYNLEEADGLRFLILELVEGETLADRLKRGPIPLDDALQIATQIAEGLAAAHERGIIHRDLKPANIKVTPEGKVKVLDFGLAKAFAGEAAAVNLSNSPTKMPSSMPGMILGTAAYMSPEQANGAVLDRRTDIFAFGAVLYEMLTGQRAFPGEIAGDILAAVIRAEPDWRKLPADTPSGIRRLLRRCLQKDRNRRLQSAGDAQIEIDEAQSEPQMDAHVVPSAPRRTERLVWTALVLTLIAAVTIVWVRRPVLFAPLVFETRLEISTPPTTDPVSLAISPDGQKIVFVAVSEGRSLLWLRSLDSVSGRPLAGTDGAMFPFWSPDSQSVGFFADGKLKRIDTASGSVGTLANAREGRGGAWSRDGTIIFAPNPSSPIFRLPSAGGEPVALTRLGASQQASHRWPQFFPDGNHFLYNVQGSPETRGVYAGQLDRAERRRLLDMPGSYGGAVYLSSGQLLFIRDGTLFAQTFDPVRLTLNGNPFLVAAPPPAGQPIRVLSASAAGPIAYRTVSAGGSRRQLAWFDRSGKEIGKVGGPGYGIIPELSPNGRFVAMRLEANGNIDVSLLEIGRSVLTRFTVDPGLDMHPIWSPDGSRIVFNSSRKGVYDLYWRPTTGTAGSEELLLETAQDKVPYDWSSNGRFLLYRQDAKTSVDLWALPLDGDRKPFPVVQTNYDEGWGQFSPDGKWIAFQSNESGQSEIYVQPFSGPEGKVGGRRQISTNGGAFVRWRRDGKELFYVAPDHRLMAVPIRLGPDRHALESDAPIPLFATRMGGAWQAPPGREYVVSPDGKRFLMNTALEEPISPISVILNWKAKP
jgi:serine/threonine protein kinase/Tol biopolymer transport system component